MFGAARKKKASPAGSGAALCRGFFSMTIQTADWRPGARRRVHVMKPTEWQSGAGVEGGGVGGSDKSVSDQGDKRGVS